MADRGTIEKLIRDAYAARVRGDLEEIMRSFDPNAQFEMIGDPRSSPPRTIGTEQLRAGFAELMRLFKFERHEIIMLIIDGDRAAVRSRITVTATLTGRTVDTELADFIEFQHGRISKFTQFCDTALVAKLSAP